jgi:hypothetical protein
MLKFDVTIELHHFLCLNSHPDNQPHLSSCSRISEELCDVSLITFSTDADVNSKEFRPFKNAVRILLDFAHSS